MNAPLLSFRAVTLRRGGDLLFEGLDLSVRSGDGLHLVGPNGSGKSSLIRLAAGLLRQESGEVHRARLALSDAHLALDRELPLRDALLFWARMAGRSGQLDDAMDALDIAHLGEVPVRLLSTGQVKRATLARVLSSAAPLWLLDEPLNGLDQPSAERLSRLVIAHRTAGGAVVVASHVSLPGSWTTLELGR